MQQRGALGGMEGHRDEASRPQPRLSRGRNNSKLKVLVRSHAMREEASPPREPTPTPNLSSPCIKLTPTTVGSPVHSPSSCRPVVVLSPSASLGNSTTPSPICISPTSTLVPSPASRCSPRSFSPHYTAEGGDSLRIEDENQEAGSSNEQSSQCTSIKNSHNCSSSSCDKCRRRERNNNLVSSSNTLTVGRANVQSTCSLGSVQSISEITSSSPCLSRENSSEKYKDTTGVDLEVFIKETLNRNAKDRAVMLQIEQDLVSFAKDKSSKSQLKFPSMSSYHRMLVHRCAAYFGMDHNVEYTGKCVIVNKTKATRIPDVDFKQYVQEDIVFPEEPKRSILKRDSNSVEDYGFKSPNRQHHGLENRRSKSFEEREEEYAKHHDGSSAEDYAWSEVPWSSTDSENSSKFRLLPPDHDFRQPGRLLKVQSEEVGDTLRPCVAKSYSFGGYGGVQVLTRGDSVISSHSAGPRLFTKQDSASSYVAWRLSPSSSGYKSQSQKSESVTPSPTSTPYSMVDTSSRQDSLTTMPHIHNENQDTQLVWAVTDIHSVPKGSIIINPQTGQPVKNNDGTLYHYDPSNPPNGFCPPDTSKPPPSGLPPQPCKERLTSPKRRLHSSPKKINLTNSSTSPSLPFAASQMKGYHFAPSGDVAQSGVCQQFPVYSGSYTPTPPQENLMQVYQPPCIMYTPYNVVQHQFDGRIEQQMSQELPPTAYYMNLSAEPSAINSTAQMTYQPTPQYWNQAPVTYYQSTQQHGPPPANRLFTSPAQAGYLQTPYSPSYTSNTSQNQDLVPMFPQQQVQMVYPTQANQQSTVVYPSHPPVVYTQNPLFPNTNHIYPTQGPHYPQNSSTPSSASSPLSNPAYCRQVQEMAQNMAQINIGPMSITSPSMQGPPPPNFNYYQTNKVPPMQFDMRPKNGVAPKGVNKFGAPKNYIVSSSQSSTGTNSPATTIIANYCSNPGMYKTPPPTPPVQNTTFSYGSNNIMPVLYQNSAVTSRTSRSPTPACESSVIDRQRMPLPPTLYQGMPYILQGDPRIIPGKSQPGAYRQPLPLQMRQPVVKQTSENFRSHNKNRKTRGCKPGIPPSGKPCNM